MQRKPSPTDASDALLEAIRQRLEQDPLCLELRCYNDPEDSDPETLHLLVLMQRELNQAEYRTWNESLAVIAAEHGRKVHILFSSPEVWHDLKRLIGSFARIDCDAHTVWARGS